MENANKNYNSFDMAKLICSILVVMIHIAPFGQQTTTNIASYLNFGLGQYLSRIAVPLFFVFNGYFLYKKTSLENFSPEYSKKYFLHILKLYILWSLIYFPFRLNNILSNPNGVIYGFAKYFKNFIFVGSYTHLWYLNALLYAIAIISFLLSRKWSPRKILCTSSVFYVFGLLGNGYYGIISPLFSVPFIGEALNVYFKIFITTRNGLFFAFFFVSLGMMLSNKEIIISRKKIITFLIISFFMLFLELCILTYFDISRDRSILIFTVPATLYSFCLLKTIHLKDTKMNIRKISSLIYYGHIWVIYAVSSCLDTLKIPIGNTPLPFIIVLAVTLFISNAIITISNKKHFRWLKSFY